MTKIKNLLFILKYRWENCHDYHPEFASLSLEDDSEKYLILRRFRALLFGYGGGWTFVDALRDNMKNLGRTIAFPIFAVLYLYLIIFFVTHQ